MGSVCPARLGTENVRFLLSIQYVTIEIKDGTIISVSKPIDTVVTIKDYDCLEEVEK